MSRPPSLDPAVKINLGIPESEKTWLELHLFDTVDQRVPRSAFSGWFRDRLREYREWKTLDLSPFGFPAGMFVRGPATGIEALRKRLTDIDTKETS